MAGSVKRAVPAAWPRGRASVGPLPEPSTLPCLSRRLPPPHEQGTVQQASPAGRGRAERPSFPSGDIPDSDPFTPKWCPNSSFPGQSHETLTASHLGAMEATPYLLAVASSAAETKARQHSGSLPGLGPGTYIHPFAFLRCKRKAKPRRASLPPRGPRKQMMDERNHGRCPHSRASGRVPPRLKHSAPGSSHDSPSSPSPQTLSPQGGCLGPLSVTRASPLLSQHPVCFCREALYQSHLGGCASLPRSPSSQQREIFICSPTAM